MDPKSVASILIKLILPCVLIVSLSSCADVPQRPYVAGGKEVVDCPTQPLPTTEAHLITPEVPPDKAYTLHFLEFDDQGWPYPDGDSAKGSPVATPSRQIDCAIGDLSKKLEQGDVRAFVFVHGWHHSAKNDDRDLNRFRDLLREYSKDKNRQVVGFYIGWRGESWDIPYIKDLTFWGRKNAAHHVAEGSVREFFARMKSIRNNWNRPKWEGRSKNCGKPEALTDGKGCPLRTVMIGHSFGGWILFASTAPYIMETLTLGADMPKGAKIPVTARERSIADLVLLLNPAFEASRYEPVHRAALHYKRARYEAPILVSVTSDADGATRNAFPVARFFNSIFQYPVNSDLESAAMRNTHGHLDEYLTHRLDLDPNRAHDLEKPELACIDEDGRPSNRDQLRKQFFDSATMGGELDLKPGWKRKMCGGLTLSHLPESVLGPYSIVWNIRTFGNVIPGHNDITELPLRDFLEQIYADIPRIPKLRIRDAQVEQDTEE